MLGDDKDWMMKYTGGSSSNSNHDIMDIIDIIKRISAGVFFFLCPAGFAYLVLTVEAVPIMLCMMAACVAAAYLIGGWATRLGTHLCPCGSRALVNQIR